MLELLRAGPVIPVIVIDDASKAAPLARALLQGGLRVLEITLRTAGALDAIRAVAREVPDAVVGAGTLLAADDLERAVAAGARFGVSPGATGELLAAARRARLPFLPGVQTASEIMAALAAGFTELKFFPAGPAGGVAALRGFGGTFPQVQFCPTGGITAETAREYLALPNVACVGGSWLAPPALVKAGDWGGITRLARQASALRTRPAA